jgi:UDP-N-acetylmuramoyl-tripeptide--D-alanyl-D-alanine ligase
MTDDSIGVHLHNLRVFVVGFFMTFWTPGNFQAVTAGTWLAPPVDAEAALSGLGIDSRSVCAGQVFLAVVGEKFDGHDFLTQARNAGAALLVVADEGKARKAMALWTSGFAAGAGVAVLLVPDTIKAMQQLASTYREVLAQTGCTVIAVGGSNGKTTTRHLIHAALSARLRGTQSPKSFNNHLGVPLTLLAAGEKDDFVVVEIGTNHPGEMAALAQIVRPDVAVITSLGHEHMEFFRTLDAVAQEEADLLRFLRQPDPRCAGAARAASAGPLIRGLAIVPGDAPHLCPYLCNLPEGLAVIRFGVGNECDATMQNCSAEESGVRFSVNWNTPPPNPGCSQSGSTMVESPQINPLAQNGEGVTVRLSLPGEHNARNALAALAVARGLGVPTQEAAAALAGTTAVPLRSQVLSLGTVTILNDCYNANPDSMAAALRMLAQFPLPGQKKGSEAFFAAASTGRRVAILGEMRELGDEGPDLHRRIGRLIATQLNIDIAVFIGKLSLFMAEEVSRQWSPGRTLAFADWSEGLPAQVAALLRPGDVVLLKGSRGMGLERLLPALEAAVGKFENCPAARGPA